MTPWQFYEPNGHLRHVAAYHYCSVSPSPNENGWNGTDVTITLTAVDNAGGTGVKQIQFFSQGQSWNAGGGREQYHSDDFGGGNHDPHIRGHG